METINVYKFSELSDNAKEKVIQEYANNNYEIFWQEETIESLKGLFEACDGIKLTDWSIGAYSRSYISFSFNSDEVEDFTGKRAMAWLENNLLSNIRITRNDYLKNRKNYFGFGKHYRIGEIKPCPFTGYCTDEDFLYSLIYSIKNGYSLKDSFNMLSDKCSDLLESEYEYQTSEEFLAEHFERNDHRFIEDGKSI
jgi:hypothetical protein